MAVLLRLMTLDLLLLMVILALQTIILPSRLFKAVALPLLLDLLQSIAQLDMEIVA
jgi:hypothetical protein